MTNKDNQPWKKYNKRNVPSKDKSNEIRDLYFQIKHSNKSTEEKNKDYDALQSMYGNEFPEITNFIEAERKAFAKDGFLPNSVEGFANNATYSPNNVNNPSTYMRPNGVAYDEKTDPRNYRQPPDERGNLNPFSYKGDSKGNDNYANNNVQLQPPPIGNGITPNKPSVKGTEKPVVDITSNIDNPKEAGGIGIVAPRGSTPLTVPQPAAPVMKKLTHDEINSIEGVPTQVGTTGGKGGLGVGNGIQLASLAAQGLSNHLERKEAEQSVEDWHNEGIADPVYDQNIDLNSNSNKNIDDSYEQATIKSETAKQLSRSSKNRTSSNAAAADTTSVGTLGASASGKTRTDKFNKERDTINEEIIMNSTIANNNNAVKRDYLEREVQHERDYIEAKNAVAAKKYDNTKQLSQELGNYGKEKEYLDLEKQIDSGTDVTVHTQGGYTTSQAALDAANKDNNPITKSRKMYYYRKLKLGGK